jgi:Holliday junction resolvase RusA-like endonuclease
MINISFDVYGIPKAQPRPRAFARKMGNKYVARVFEAGTAEEWKSLIAAAAKPHTPPTPILGPVCVDLTFFFPRPKSHFRTGKNAGALRDDAPLWHTGKPDRDNLEKAVLDALTQLGGFWRDDSQVCDGRVVKYYRSEPGVMVRIGEKEVGV